MKYLIILLVILSCNLKVNSQTPDKKSLSHITPVDTYSDKIHFRNLYKNAEMKYAFKGKTKEEFKSWQLEFRKELKNILGITRLEAELTTKKIKARKIDSEDLGWAVRERWEIWTEPTVVLPFVLMLPKNMKGKLPVMITPHGHSKNTESYAGIYNSVQDSIEGEVGERNIGVQAVKNNFIAIVPTTRGFGKTRTKEDIEKDAPYSCRIQLMHDLLVGRTPIGDRVWDVSKLIDWALKELPVDKSKIVVSGNSGGGTTALFAAACDTRISACIPASYFSTFTGSIGSIEHCDCNYIPGILNYGEMADIAGLIAPRYFCALHGRKDDIFPIVETQKAFEHLQHIYTVAGYPDNCKLYIGNEGHRYYKEGAWSFLERINFLPDLY